MGQVFTKIPPAKRKQGKNNTITHQCLAFLAYGTFFFLLPSRSRDTNHDTRYVYRVLLSLRLLSSSTEQRSSFRFLSNSGEICQTVKIDWRVFTRLQILGCMLGSSVHYYNKEEQSTFPLQNRPLRANASQKTDPPNLAPFVL